MSGCDHRESFSDGTTRFCSYYCGHTIAYLWRPSGEWIEGEPTSDFRWTDEGWEPRATVHTDRSQ